MIEHAETNMRQMHVYCILLICSSSFSDVPLDQTIASARQVQGKPRCPDYAANRPSVSGKARLSLSRLAGNYQRTCWVALSALHKVPV